MGSIKFPHTSGNSMSIAAPATNPASDLELKLPATIGTANQYLKNSGTAGTLEFGDVDTGNGTIKSWGYFTGTDTGSITTAGSGNVASISDEGTGHFKVTYTSAIGSANYAVISSTQDADGTGRNDGDMTIHAHDTAYTEIKFFKQQGHSNMGRDMRDPDGFSFIAVA